MNRIFIITVSLLFSMVCNGMEQKQLLDQKDQYPLELFLKSGDKINIKKIPDLKREERQKYTALLILARKKGNTTKDNFNHKHPNPTKCHSEAP